MLRRREGGREERHPITLSHGVCSPQIPGLVPKRWYGIRQPNIEKLFKGINMLSQKKKRPGWRMAHCQKNFFPGPSLLLDIRAKVAQTTPTAAGGTTTDRSTAPPPPPPPLSVSRTKRTGRAKNSQREKKKKDDFLVPPPHGKRFAKPDISQPTNFGEGGHFGAV